MGMDVEKINKREFKLFSHVYGHFKNILTEDPRGHTMKTRAHRSLRIIFKNS